jgi:hypothetical protein
MAQEVTMNCVSKHKRTMTGQTVKSRDEQTSYTKQLIEGAGMYTFVYGTGSKRKSETRHMTETQAKAHKLMLEGK